MTEEEVKEKLIALTQEHRDLDDALLALERAGTFDQVQVQRLKKKKLMLRDKIAKIRAELHPDIIA